MYREFRIYTDADKHLGFLYCDMSSEEEHSIYRGKGTYNYFNHNTDKRLTKKIGRDVPPKELKLLQRPVVLYFPSGKSSSLNWDRYTEFENFDALVKEYLHLFGTFNRVTETRWVIDRPAIAPKLIIQRPTKDYQVVKRRKPEKEKH